MFGYNPCNIDYVSLGFKNIPHIFHVYFLFYKFVYHCYFVLFVHLNHKEPYFNKTKKYVTRFKALKLRMTMSTPVLVQMARYSSTILVLENRLYLWIMIFFTFPFPLTLVPFAKILRYTNTKICIFTTQRRLSYYFYVLNLSLRFILNRKTCFIAVPACSFREDLFMFKTYCNTIQNIF